MNQVRWNIVVSPDTDQALRIFLARQRGSRKGNLSRFIEEAVLAHILELTAEQVKEANANVDDDELQSLVSKAMQWARRAR